MRYSCTANRDKGRILGISADGIVTVLFKSGGFVAYTLEEVTDVRRISDGGMRTSDGRDVIELHSGKAFLLEKNGTITVVPSSSVILRGFGFHIMGDRLVDVENSNSVSLAGRNLAKATAMLNSLINCTDCDDCSNLVNCSECTRCTDSQFLNGCIDCHGSHDLTNCESVICGSYITGKDPV